MPTGIKKEERGVVLPQQTQEKQRTRFSPEGDSRRGSGPCIIRCVCFSHKLCPLGLNCTTYTKGSWFILLTFTRPTRQLKRGVCFLVQESLIHCQYCLSYTGLKEEHNQGTGGTRQVTPSTGVLVLYWVLKHILAYAGQFGNDD